MTLYNQSQSVTNLRGLTRHFDNAVRTAEPFYPRVCNIIESFGSDEQYSTLGQVPMVREWIGDRKFKQLRAASFTVANKSWEDSLLISGEDIEDARLNQYSTVIRELGNRAARHPDKLLFENLISVGISTACWDGQFFFDTDHEWGDSSSQSNDLTYNATDHTAVTAEEAKSAFHLARRTMLGYKDDQGEFLNEPITGSMRSLMVLCPLALEEAFTKGLKASILSNDDNITLDGKSTQIVSSAYLTDDSRFYLFDLSGAIRPFIFQRRKGIQRQIKEKSDIESKDVKFMTYARYNVAYWAWWKAVTVDFT